jgi:hypothetical protein
MAPRCLTVLVPIRPGEDGRLRAVLRAIGDDINGKRLSAANAHPHIDFVRSRGIHFARFAVLNDPDRGAGRTRLLFASVYDGELDAHLTELIAITSNMDAIWARCEGYKDAGGFAEFIRAHAYEPEAYYIAFRGETAESIKRAIAARRRLQELQDSGGTQRPAALRDALQRVIRAAPIVWDLVRAVARCGFANVYFGTRRITASLDRYLVFRLFNRITLNPIPSLKSPFTSVALDNCSAFAPLAAGDEIPSGPTAVAPAFREDAVTQNQLTVVTVVDPSSVDRVRAVMAAIDSYAKRLAPPGSLIGISTIHFVRWLVIDQGRRLMLVSDYDGSWESYIDEFAEMILSGLDAIWETSFGSPAGGAGDVPAFKRFLRSHQVPSDVFFSAYPDETVLNVVSDTGSASRW